MSHSDKPDFPFAFLFDMDGVIVNSTALHVQAWQIYLQQHGREVPELKARMLGKHNADIVREFFATDLDDEAVCRHGAAKEAIYRQLLEPVFSTALVAGVLDFISRHRDVPMAVGSNAEAANVDLVLRLAGVRNFFGVILDSGQVRNPKPNPEIYLKAAERLGVPPERCIVFEDSSTGVAAGRAANMRVVGVQTTVSDLDGVDLAVVDFSDSQLEPWLRGILQS